MNDMTQDMKMDTILHTITKLLVRNWRTRVLSAAHSSALTGVLTQRQNLCADGITARVQRDYVSCSTRLRLVVMMLLIMVGVNGAWGQDYSGKYYLANDNNKSNVYDYKGYDNVDNFYLCPATEYYNGTTTYSQENDNPFLTTAKTGQADNALWIVEKVEDKNYYTFKLKKGDINLYITVNDVIPNINKSHRRRVHLEPLTNEALNDRNYFTIEQITQQDGIVGYTIGCLDKYKTGEYQYLNPAGGNYDQTIAKGDDHGGIVGFYKKGNVNSDASGSIWFFEVPKPIIHIDGNNKLSLTCANEDVTIHYTIDGEDPSATGTDDIYNTTDNIQLTEGVHTIKAIAVMNNGNVGYASGVITQEVTVFSTEHPYLISNNQNPWTIGSETKNIFYLIPSDNTTVNTTSMPRPTMEWNIRYTGETEGELYLNIINAKTGGYLYRTGDNIYMKAPSEKTSLENDGDNGFKFYLIKRTDGYSIVPYGITNKYLNKASGNADKGVVNLSGTNNVNSQWNFATRDEVLNDGILPFTSSDANTSLYYKIQNGNGDNYFIIPPTTTNYATASDATDDATVKKMSWCFIKVEDPNDDDWLTYYKVVNAETGKALHYTGITNTSLNVGTYDDGDDNYKFAFVKSPTSNYYYIVPKSVKDDQLAQISMIWRDNNALKKGATRGVNNNIWKFTPADLFCNTPVFEKEAGPITISCVPDITRIYYTTDGTEPNPNDENQRYTNNTPFSASDQLLIKAIAFVSDGTNSASSAVITLLNKPDVTLETGPYTYKGTAWEPSVTSVSIGETVAPTSPATYTVAYSSNNTDAGTANVTITDNDDTDAWYIWNVPETEFTIDRKAVTITAKGASKEYDGTELTESDFTHSDLEVGDTHVFTVVMTTESTITDAGTQSNVIAKVDDIEVITGTEKAVGNYLVTTINGTLEITKAPVTVTADNQTKGYDDPDPTLTATIVGLKNGEAEDKITYTISRTEGENIGDYIITPAGATVQGNYTVSYITGTLTITAKAIGDGTTPAEGIDITITYDGSSYQVTVKQGNNTLEGGETKDYTWTSTGTDSYVVTVTGRGNYANSAQATYIKHDFFDTTPDDLSLTETAAVYYATQDMQVSDEFDAYYVTKLENNELTIAKVEVDENENKISYIPANQPVLLLSKEGGTSKPLGFTLKPYTGTQMTFPAEGEEGANLLKVVTAEGGKSVALTEVYIFSAGEFVLSMAGTMSKGKFYLENPAYNTSSPARKVVRIRKRAATSIDNDEITGIDSQSMDSWYTIDGRRLSSKPTKKGLYIKRSEKGKSGSVTVIK